MDRCGHCKAMEPEYKKLAKKMKKTNPNLIVARMDATANDIHPIFGQIKGYPTLFFLPIAHKQQPVQYEGGEFTFKSLKAFADQQASIILTDEERMGLPATNTDSAAEELLPQDEAQSTEQRTNESEPTASKEHKVDEL